MALTVYDVVIQRVIILLRIQFAYQIHLASSSSASVVTTTSISERRPSIKSSSAPTKSTSSGNNCAKCSTPYGTFKFCPKCGEPNPNKTNNSSGILYFYLRLI